MKNKVIEKLKKHWFLAKMLIAASFSFSITAYLNKDLNDTNNQILYILIFITSFLWLHYYKPSNAKHMKGLLVYSSIYSSALYIGKSIRDVNSISPIFHNLQSAILFIFNVVVFSIVMTTVIEFVINKLEMENNNTYENAGRKFIIIWLIIFVSWLPCYLSYFPGILSYDSPGQIEQALGLKALTQHQTPIHTFYISMHIYVGRILNFNPLIIYSISQMLFLSYALSIFIKFLMDKKANKYFCILSIVFFALYPVFAIFSFIPTKDVLSSAFFLLSICRGTNINNCRINKGLFVIDVVFACLFRHNVFYAYLLSLIIVIVAGYNQYKRIIVLAIISLCLVVFVNLPLYKILGITKDNVQEHLSLPIQQISMTVSRHYKDLDLDEQEKISKYFKSVELVKRKYNPRFADPIKNNFRSGNFIQDRKSFFDLWITLFSKYPIDYIDAFLALNLPYWYQDATIPDPFSKEPYIATWQDKAIKIDNFNLNRQNLLPAINEFYENIANYTYQKNIPFIPDLFSLALPIWLVLLALIKNIVNKKRDVVITLIPSVMLWVTLMLGQ